MNNTKMQQLGIMAGMLSLALTGPERTEVYDAHIPAMEVDQESIDVAIKDSTMKREMKSMKKANESYHRSLGPRPSNFTKKEWKSYTTKSFFQSRWN